MIISDCIADAVVIGGGFYGSVIAIYLAKQRGLGRVFLIEKEPQLLMRASYHNQARVHNGYHYPRSFTTAFRSRLNFKKFVCDWPQVIKQDFIKLYAIARRNSKVSAKQFERFCYEIGAPIKPTDSALTALFEPKLIEKVFLVEEPVFDTTRLARWVKQKLDENNIPILLETHATAIVQSSENSLIVKIDHKNGTEGAIRCRHVFNCSYSGLNQLRGGFPGTQTLLKQEITEMALMRVPHILKDMGITLMDGPFFSMMPFPSRNLHTLSHVRYTPHVSWKDERGIDPYQRLTEYDRSTRVDRMIRDVRRYLPSMVDTKYEGSLFEVKTVLLKNEGDDGRPILFEKHPELPGCYSILGSKIDNIYDVLQKLDAEPLKSIESQL